MCPCIASGSTEPVYWNPAHFSIMVEAGVSSGAQNPTYWSLALFSMVDGVGSSFRYSGLLLFVQLAWWGIGFYVVLWSSFLCRGCGEVAPATDGHVCVCVGGGGQSRQSPAYIRKYKQTRWLLPAGCRSRLGEGERWQEDA